MPCIAATPPIDINIPRYAIKPRRAKRKPKSMAFAFVSREGEATSAQFKAVTGLPRPIAAVAGRLATQRPIEPFGTGGRYAPAEHPRGPLGRIDRVGAKVDADRADLFTAQAECLEEDLSTAQVQPLAELSETHRAITDYCDVPRRLTEVLAVLGPPCGRELIG